MPCVSCYFVTLSHLLSIVFAVMSFYRAKCLDVSVRCRELEGVVSYFSFGFLTVFARSFIVSFS